MPASYAHYRFGKEISAGLSGDAKQCVHRFRRLFDMGLQGPDFFFYYNPVMKTATGALGGAFHSQSGREFFTRAAAAADTEAGRAYLYGLLGHYCLDTRCHPFVERMVKEGQARHVALESEFDRYLMERDGLPQPHAQDVTPHIRLTRGECVTVAAFFPPASPNAVNRSVQNMARCLRFLANKNRTRTRRLLGLVDKRLLDSLVPEESVEEYARMDSELLARFNHAVGDYASLAAQLTALLTDQAPLGADFAADFGGVEKEEQS